MKHDLELKLQAWLDGELPAAETEELRRLRRIRHKEPRAPYAVRRIGRSLLVHLAQVAVRENCGRYVWQVLDWNTPSIEFYKSLGAKLMREWLTMRVEGPVLENMATRRQSAAEAHD